MPRYDHLSKAGSRFLKHLENVPKRGQRRAEQFMNKALPEFVRPNNRTVPEEQRFADETHWKFVPGDRVVITHGKYKGTVAVIKDLEVATNSFILDGNGPSRKVPVAKQYWLENQSTHMLSLPVSLKRKHLKLLADIDDPANPGQTKTVAVKDVTFDAGTYYDKDRKKVMPYRCVVGRPDLVVPWPTPEPKPDGVLGTEPKLARQQTFWVDTIVRNSIPKNAFLTLRNPHSKYKKKLLTAKDIAKLVAPKMPLSDTKKKFLEEKEMLAKREKPQLTEADIELIGSRVKEFLETAKQ
ncbi:uncharacterized protein GVI51_F03355 [Nakaseomyces glabratus]|uniref:54S ribosomal protein L40, mitochondrial n=2 Tax=Candida glabrata TaxID=5478 RepID=Q6FUG5_CANGA|nr:mitochondrial 54S ribosomal protein YmL40 [Nakaseomyces glabratus]KAH7589434.1 hypothetical protein J7297_01383 [Nakaseomyces glabratus]KAH7594605.1 hypothetical protein J7296_01385 [Nakaseomyces glabratus]KAH7605089.1 hypothetical protein J7294_01382 [Nakaseomyces glabratus]KAH7607405.1 hypothetical protein J7293_01381 [Nakaseomyces glabratus]KAI8387701.1 hypothetical protein J6894_01384 [Nakaseomyces glabratus]|eukprot:XP_446129.1 mitochondrial 54S ribosomal protein YmL40 [[Candida] glabrata]